MVCVLAWVNWKICVWFLCGVLVHELGHLAALRSMRVTVREIRLRLSGAMIGTERMNYRTEQICAAAGPGASILLGVTALRIAPHLAIVSLLLGVINLLPMYPLDGGRILRAALLIHVNPEQAERIGRVTAFVVAAGLMLLACWWTVYLQAGIWPIFAALILLWRSGETE